LADNFACRPIAPMKLQSSLESCSSNIYLSSDTAQIRTVEHRRT